MRNNIAEARRSYENTLPSGKFTQDNAADFFGVASSTYKKWEQGAGKLNGEILCAIADKYNCSVDYLLCRVSDPTPYRPVQQSPALQGDEERLVDAYRYCTKREQSNILSLAETMADGGRAKNNDVRADTVEVMGA